MDSVIEVKEVTTDVYYFEEFGGVNGTWLWDLGFVYLVGSKNYPMEKPDSMNIFSAVASGINAESIRTKEPEKTVDLRVFLGDYCCYIPSGQEKPSYALSPNNEPYRLVDVAPYEDEEKLVILEENKSHGRKKNIAIKYQDFQSEWTPVNTF